MSFRRGFPGPMRCALVRTGPPLAPQVQAAGRRDVILVGNQARTPLVQRRVASFFGREPRCFPDEDVAIGAAIQAAVLSGNIAGVDLLDVVPLSFGIETWGGTIHMLIQKNTHSRQLRSRSTPQVTTTTRPWRSMSCRGKPNTRLETGRSAVSTSRPSRRPRARFRRSK